MILINYQNDFVLLEGPWVLLIYVFLCLFTIYLSSSILFYFNVNNLIIISMRILELILFIKNGNNIYLFLRTRVIF